MYPLRPRRCAQDGFTILEALTAIVILMIFAVTSTMALNIFNDRASRNRNAEAARAVVDDYVNYLLNDAVPAPAVTAAGTDLDGDGTTDGVVCASIPGTSISGAAVTTSRTIPATLPLIVTRTASPTPVVTGTLYWRVQTVGKTYGCAADTDLVQVNFLLQYTYRNQTFYYKAVTFKANT